MSDRLESQPKPVFYMNRNPEQEDVSDWVRRFYRSLPPGLFFFDENGTLWVAQPNRPLRALTTPPELKGAASWIFRLMRTTDTKEGTRETMGQFTKGEAEELFYSLARFEELPQFTARIVESAVGLDPSGVPYLLTPGYDPVTKILYHPQSTPIAPAQGVDHLKKAFSGVPFENEESRANLMAWLLSGVVFNERFEPTPMLVISGNQPGIGKTCTQEACGLILTGVSQSPIMGKGDEFEKQLSAHFHSGNRFICFDNIISRPGEPYHNPSLAKLLTSGWSKTARFLGHSYFVSQKGVLFSLTANSCRLDNDLSIRSLSVKLHREKLGPITPYVLDYVRQYRREIYAELLGLALSGPPLVESQRHLSFRFRAWLDFVLPRIEPHFGPLGIASGVQLDDAVIGLFQWCAERIGEDRECLFQARELISGLDIEQRLGGLKSRFSDYPTAAGRTKALSHFLVTLCNDGTRVTLGEDQFWLTAAAGPRNQPHQFRCSRQPLSEVVCAA